MNAVGVRADRESRFVAAKKMAAVGRMAGRGRRSARPAPPPFRNLKAGAGCVGLGGSNSP